MITKTDEEIQAVLESGDLLSLQEIIDEELTAMVRQKMEEYEQEAWDKLMYGTGDPPDMRGIYENKD